MVILVFFLVISVNRRLFQYFGSYSGISLIPVILVNRRTALKLTVFLFHHSIFFLILQKYVEQVTTIRRGVI